MMPTFENISQRVVYSYQRQLAEFVLFASIFIDQKSAMRCRHHRRRFTTFSAPFTTQAYTYPELFWLAAQTRTFTCVQGMAKRKKRM